MFLLNNYCGKVFLLSLTIIIAIFSVQFRSSVYYFESFLLFYVICVLSLTIWLTWIGVQTLLKQSTPFTYDLKNNVSLRAVKYGWGYVRSGLNVHSVDLNESYVQTVDKSIDCRSHVHADAFQTKDSNCIKRGIKCLDQRIDDFVKDIENSFVLKWYLHISEDETFLNETGNVLDEMVRRFLQIVIQVENKKLVHGVLMILLKHVKEFRKTVKRHQRNGGCVEDLYRYAHIGSKSNKAFNHFMCQITTRVFRQFIKWELYTSVPCRCLVSILAKKLTTYLLTYVSNPTYVNYQIAQACGSENKKENLQLHKYDSVSLSDVDHSENIGDDELNKNGEENKRERRNQCRDNLGCRSNTPKISPKKLEAKMSFTGKNQSDKVDCNKDKAEKLRIISGLVSHAQVVKKYETFDGPDASRLVTKPVKIYESNKSVSETWINSSDLECISLGQDLLVLQDMNDSDVQINDLIEKKLWKDNSDCLEVDEKMYSVCSTTEKVSTEPTVEVTDFAGNTPLPNIPSFLTSTIKPIGNVTVCTLHNMKELQQSTVNNVVKPVSQVTSSAIHKIGDLQDEAAGVMEGILDFGMAGIRKGLRLTGLHDDITDKQKEVVLKKDVQKLANGKFQGKEAAFIDVRKSSDERTMQTVDQKLTDKAQIQLIQGPHMNFEEIKLEQCAEDNIWMNPLTNESPNFDGQLLLERLSTVSAKPVSTSNSIDTFETVPRISTEDTSNSPDPEYEDTTDLATTTAKLRSLLQQRSSESSLTTPALSPMHPDESIRTPIECTGSSVEDMIEVDGALPSLYKFCARTATGVFQNTLNTIKTALPSNVGDHDHSSEHFNQQSSIDNWTFVAADVTSDDLAAHVEKLLNERRMFCTVDNAYEAVETLDALDHDDAGWNSTPTRNYYDELDDFDVHFPLTKTLVDIFCELIADTNALLLQESVIKTFLVHFGGLNEDFIDKESEKIIRNINTLIGPLSHGSDKQSMPMKLSVLCDIFLDTIPGYAKKIVGNGNLNSAAAVLIKSFQSHKINQDIVLQLFELFAFLIIDASSKMSPTYSA